MNSENTNPDESVDAILVNSLNPNSPKSFFLFAGAGSGKTRTLVNVLTSIKKEYGNTMLMYGKRVGVITYTNAACDEICRRVGFDLLFHVATIHSFIWEFINPFQEDIRAWLKTALLADIEAYTADLAKNRSTTTKIFKDLESKRTNAEKRFFNLDSISKFTYNPNGTNNSRDSLSHSEVIKLGSYFLRSTSLGKNILTQKYPILLIDESQDTNKELVETFFYVQEQLPSSFSLGLIGDKMQRIYFDGKADLGEKLPPSWIGPTKVMNYRCPKRIVNLINLIRKDVDGIEQIPRTDSSEGLVRLFIIQTVEDSVKARIEEVIREKMADKTGDVEWRNFTNGVKCLTLEHHMAANRMGFLPFYEPLSRIDSLKTGLLDGSIPMIRLLTQCIQPLQIAFSHNDDFEIARIAKEYCPSLTRKNIAESLDQIKLLHSIENKMQLLRSLWDDGKDPSVLEILKVVSEQRLFEIPDDILPIIARVVGEQTEDDAEKNSEGAAWESALSVPFSMVAKYASYISDKSSFDTHQGVKGLEFERVMVIIDDKEAKGFMFSYEKLLGVKEQSKTDLENLAGGKETGIDRTKRLFYVVCSRATKSLAIVAYTVDARTLKNNVIRNGWFGEDEIDEIESLS